jgi:septal ring factor EnvC (AmiA/AmiB activator)
MGKLTKKIDGENQAEIKMKQEFNAERDELKKKLGNDQSGLEASLKKVTKERDELKYKLEQEMAEEKAIKKEWMGKIVMLKGEMVKKVNEDSDHLGQMET